MSRPNPIRQCIVERNAVIAKGYGAGITPQNFERQLNGPQLDGLVDFPARSTGE